MSKYHVEECQERQAHNLDSINNNRTILMPVFLDFRHLFQDIFVI